MTSDLSNKSLKGIMWTIVQNIGLRVVSFAGQILLAWVLAPEDFGEISLVLSVFEIISQIGNFGLENILLKTRKRGLVLWSRYAIGFSLIAGILAFLIMVGTGEIASVVYKNQNLFYLILISALAIPPMALTTVSGAAIRQGMNFRLISLYSLFESAAQQAAIIVCAWAGAKAYSFVLPLPLFAIVKMFFFWKKSELHFCLNYRMLAYKRLFNKGLIVFSVNMLIALRNNADYIILGLLCSKEVLGQYFFAFKLAAVPVYTLASSLTNVLLPALSSIQNDTARQLNASIKSSKVIAAIAIPTSFFLATEAAPIIRLLFDNRWNGAIPFFQILTIGLAFNVVPCVTGALLNANGRFTMQFWQTAIHVPAFILLISLGAYFYNSMGVAIAVMIFFIIYSPTFTYAALKHIGGTAKDVSLIYLPPVLASTSSCFITLLVILKLPFLEKSNFFHIIFAAILNGALYVTMIKLIAVDTYQEIITRTTQMSSLAKRKFH